MRVQRYMQKEIHMFIYIYIYIHIYICLHQNISRLNAVAMPYYIWHECAKLNIPRRRLHLLSRLVLFWRRVARQAALKRCSLALKLCALHFPLPVLLELHSSRAHDSFVQEAVFNAWFVELRFSRALQLCSVHRWQ
jgi:hypothetical protein